MQTITKHLKLIKDAEQNKIDAKKVYMRIKNIVNACVYNIHLNTSAVTTEQLERLKNAFAYLLRCTVEYNYLVELLDNFIETTAILNSAGIKYTADENLTIYIVE